MLLRKQRHVILLIASTEASIGLVPEEKALDGLGGEKNGIPCLCCEGLARGLEG